MSPRDAKIRVFELTAHSLIRLADSPQRLRRVAELSGGRREERMVQTQMKNLARELEGRAQRARGAQKGGDDGRDGAPAP